MQLLRSIAAIVAGYAALGLIVILATLVAVRFMLPGAGAEPTVPYLAVNLLYSLAGAVCGGYGRRHDQRGSNRTGQHHASGWHQGGTNPRHCRTSAR